MKYTLLKNKATGERSVRNNKTGEIVKESENQEQYSKLRKMALRNSGVSARDEAMRALGLSIVRGSVSGSKYYE